MVKLMGTKFLRNPNVWSLILAGFMSTCLGLSACVSIPGTDHSGLVLVSRGQEIQMGEQSYRELLSKERLSSDARLNGILARVGKRIAAVTPVTDIQWEFKLIESKEMNAFCLPGGKVAFYTGILPVLQNEAAMAVVMGHEVAHAVARHGAQRISQGMLTQFGLVAFDQMVASNSEHRDVFMAAAGMGASVGVILPFSRSHESEADRLGIIYAADAGYDPAEAVAFWKRFSKATGSGKPPAFLSTHPADEARIQALSQLQPQAQAAYAKAAQKSGLGERL